MCRIGDFEQEVLTILGDFYRMFSISCLPFSQIFGSLPSTCYEQYRQKYDEDFFHFCPY